MDEALRIAVRGPDWRRRATALRHAGREAEARRCLEVSAEAGHPEAWDLLDEWFPLGDVEARFAEHGHMPPVEFLGDPDPRLARPLEDWAARHDQPWVLELVQLPLIDRLVGAATRCGGRALARTRLTPDEVLALYEALEGQGWSVEEDWPHDRARDYLRMNAAWLLAAFGDDRTDAARASLRTESVGAPPAWLPDAPPAVTRDPLTLCIHRNVALAALDEGSAGPSIVLLDVDDTKRGNDHFGCQPVDVLLCRVARALQDGFGDRVARYGGDEFLVLTEDDDVEAKTQSALEAVAEIRVPVAEAEATLRATISAGLSRVTPARGWKQALQTADEALHRAKLAGRNTYRLSP